jgi:hypothetical protein
MASWCGLAPVTWLSRNLCESWVHADGCTNEAGPLAAPEPHEVRESHKIGAGSRGSVVLIDGAQLADLMIEHGVGVAAESLRIPKIDTDYFEGE